MKNAPARLGLQISASVPNVHGPKRNHHSSVLPFPFASTSTCFIPIHCRDARTATSRPVATAPTYLCNAQSQTLPVMAPSSAFVGEKPATSYDAFIITGFWRLVTRTQAPSSKPFPSIIPLSEPPTAGSSRPHNTRQWEMYAQLISVMVLITIITGTRLLTRLCKKDLKWGLDDWAIILALGFALGFCGVRIKMTRSGGAGKRMYDARYTELEIFIQVSR